MTDLFENKDGAVGAVANPSTGKNTDTGIQSGDVIYVHRGLYKHYGVYAGDGKVIHFASLSGKETNAEDAVVHETSLENFLEGGILKIDRKSKAIFSGPKIVERARSLIGRKSYNLVLYNCEHFANWCKTGVYESDQVNAAIDVAAEGAIYLIESIKGERNPERKKKLISKFKDYLD